MDSARNRYTYEIVTGFDLKRLEFVDKDAYICLGCNIPVNPVSFELHNKKAAHFRLFERTHHFFDCFEVKREALESEATRRSVAKPEGLPFPIPSKLVLVNDETTKINEFSGEAEWSNQKIQPKRVSGITAPHKHNYTVRTIRPLVRFYLEFPWDRHAKLSVPKVAGEKYNEIFVRVSNENIIHPEQKIFFGNLRFKEKLIKNSNHIDVTLSQGVYENRQAISNYIVRIDTSAWTERQKQSLIDEIESAQEEIKEIWFKIKNRKIKRTAKTDNNKAWFFFLGTRDAHNPFLFHVNNFRLIACTTGQYIQGNAAPDKNTKNAAGSAVKNTNYSNPQTELSLPPITEKNNNQSTPIHIEDKLTNNSPLYDSWLSQMQKRTVENQKMATPAITQNVKSAVQPKTPKPVNGGNKVNQPSEKQKINTKEESLFAGVTKIIKRFFGF